MSKEKKDIIPIEELIIGCWVMVKDTPRQVLGITNANKGSVFIYEPEERDEHPIYNIEMISGIPLTKELLEKNNFSLIEENDLYFAYIMPFKEYNFLYVCLYKKPIAGVEILVQTEVKSKSGDGINKFHNCDIRYLHQLQLALKSVGIGLEFEL